MPDSTPTALPDALTVRFPALACPSWCRVDHDDPRETLGIHESKDLFSPLVHLLRLDIVDLSKDGTLRLEPSERPDIFIEESRSPETGSIGEYSRAEAEQIIDGLTRALAAIDEGDAMTPATFHVVDTIVGTTTTGTVDELAEVLPTWYSDAPAEVLAGIADMLDAIRRRDHWDDHAHALGLAVRLVPTAP